MITDVSNSVLCAYPPERHVFEGTDHLCSVCKRPRAMHLHDGFRPNAQRPKITFDPKASFRGHPYWSRPGTARNEKERVARRVYSSSKG